VVRNSVMVEFHRCPLRVQQSKLDGWWFIFVDEVPALVMTREAQAQEERRRALGPVPSVRAPR